MYRLRAPLAAAMLLAFSQAAWARNATLTVILKDSNVSNPNGTECVSEMSAGDKAKHFDAGDTITWSFDATRCTVANTNSTSSGKRAKLQFGSRSKLIPGINLKWCKLSMSTPTCTIVGTIVNTAAGAPSMSRHPYAIIFDGDIAGDPEVDIDNGGNGPPPNVPPNRGGTNRGGTPPPPPPPNRGGNNGGR